MITIRVKYGNTTFAGITFSSVARPEVLQAFLSMDGTTNSQIFHMINYVDKTLVSSAGSEPSSVDRTLAITMQSDTLGEIDNLTGRFAGIKNVLVELLKPTAIA
jgi:hypothetical protein